MKKVLIVVLAIIMIIGSTTTAFASKRVEVEDKSLTLTQEELNEMNSKINKFKTENKISKSKTLEVLNILKGTGKGLELEKGLTRVEGTVIYSRLFGLDHDIQTFNFQNKEYATGFYDIPEWARKDISYLQYSKIINGISPSEFGSNKSMTAEQFTTLILRGLGYKDTEGEFVWNKSLDMAVEIGLLTVKEKEEIEKDSLFTREDMSILAYNTLFEQNKNDKSTVAFDRTSKLANENGASQLLYVELTEEEIAELSKVSAINKYNEKPYEVFENDEIKRNTLYTKLINMANNCVQLFEFNINNSEEKIYITGIDTIKHSDTLENIIIIDYTSDLDYNFSFDTILEKDKNILKAFSDSLLGWSASSYIVYNKLMEKYKVSLKDGYYQIGSRTQGVSRTFSIMTVEIPEHGVIKTYDVISDKYVYKINTISTN